MIKVRAAAIAAGIICGVGLGACDEAVPPKPAPIHLVITNAEIFTADPVTPRAEAVAIAGDSIVAVGSNTYVLSVVEKNRAAQANQEGVIPDLPLERIDAGGRLLVPGLTDAHVRFAGPPVAPVAGAADLMAAEARLLRRGVTAVHWMAADRPINETLGLLDQTGGVLKWTVYGPLGPNDPLEAQTAQRARKRDRVRLGGAMLTLDGSLKNRGACYRSDYADKPGWRGTLAYEDGALRPVLSDLPGHAQGLVLAMNGDCAIEQALTAMEAVGTPDAWRALRVRIDGGAMLTPDLIERAATLGMVVVKMPAELSTDKMDEGGVLPTEGAEHFQALASVRKAGLRLAFGSDLDEGGLNPFRGMMLAILNPANPDDGLDREKVLRAYTSGGAFVEGLEESRGKIKDGMAADLTLLSQNVLEVPVDQLPATRSLLTVIDGLIVHDEMTDLAPAQ